MDETTVETDVVSNDDPDYANIIKEAAVKAVATVVVTAVAKEAVAYVVKKVKERRQQNAEVEQSEPQDT